MEAPTLADCKEKIKRTPRRDVAILSQIQILKSFIKTHLILKNYAIFTKDFFDIILFIQSISLHFFRMETKKIENSKEPSPLIDEIYKELNKLEKVVRILKEKLDSI